VKWLFADSNVTPPQALDSVEAIVTHQEIRVRGMLLTLKLVDWQLAGSIPDYVQRVHSWGFDDVRTRQLAFNRREFCLAALKSRGGTRIARGEANAKSR
jgi:23S rRNA (cytidine2498-2'-O)-methyltransferase